MFAVVLLGTAAIGAFPAAEPGKLLWQIGRADRSPAEFALAPADYRQFYSRFCSPEHAYYIGLAKPESDWPCVLPGPLDDWAGGGRRAAAGTWDMLHTLLIGFVLAQAPRRGACTLTIQLCDTHPQHPPRLRVTVNGEIFERETRAGGSVDSLVKGDLQSAKAQAIRVEFPASLLRRGHNEIVLRSARGNWLLFDELRLETPADVSLAPAANTVIRSVTTADYAVSPDKATPATIRVEIFRAGSAGRLTVQTGDAATTERVLEPGMQVLEIPAAASAAGKPTRIRVGIYHDEGSTHLLVENNVVHHTKFAPFNIHYAKEGTVRNNIFALGKLEQVSRSRVEPHKSVFFENNIVYWREGELFSKNWKDVPYTFHFHPKDKKGTATVTNTFDCDWNLYFNPGQKLDEVKFDGAAWAEWQKRGKDPHFAICRSAVRRAGPRRLHPQTRFPRLCAGLPAH